MEEPLLSTDGRAAGRDEVLERLEAGLDDELDFQGTLAAKPKEVIKYLEEHGVEKLGTFELQDSEFYDKVGESGMLLCGEDEKMVDYESMWRSELSRRPDRRKNKGDWGETVAVEAWVVTIRNAAAAEKVGLLFPLLQRYQAGKCSMLVFGMPAVQAVVEFKWEHWAKKLLWVQLALYLVWLLAFTGVCMLFQDEDETASMAQLIREPKGAVGVVLEIVALIAMVPFLVIEWESLRDFGWSWFIFQNIIDALTYIAQIAIAVMHLGRIGVGSDALILLMATQCILLWLRLQYYLRVFRATKTAFLDTISVVVGQCKWFLLFMAITLYGFASAFHVLYRLDQEDIEEYRSIGRSLFTVFVAAIASFEQKTYINTHNPAITAGLFVVFQFVMGFILLNLLIALMTNAHDKLTRNAGLRAVLSKAQSIDELESSLPGWAKRRAGQKWYPRYLHVLKIAPAGAGMVRAPHTWVEGERLLDPQEESLLRLRAVEARLDALQHELRNMRPEGAKDSEAMQSGAPGAGPAKGKPDGGAGNAAGMRQGGEAGPRVLEPGWEGKGGLQAEEHAPGPQGHSAQQPGADGSERGAGAVADSKAGTAAEQSKVPNGGAAAQEATAEAGTGLLGLITRLLPGQPQQPQHPAAAEARPGGQQAVQAGAGQGVEASHVDANGDMGDAKDAEPVDMSQLDTGESTQEHDEDF